MMSSAARPETLAEKYKGVYIARDGTYNFVDRTGTVWVGLSLQSAKRRSLEVYPEKKKQSEPKTTFDDDDEDAKMITDPNAIELDLLAREDFVPEEASLNISAAAATSARDIGEFPDLLGSLNNHESHT